MPPNGRMALIRRPARGAGIMVGVPEGDTVWLAAQRMNTALAGATLRRGELRVPQLAAVDLAGATVTEVVPRGKHMLTRFTDGRTLRTHYRMDGSWHIYRPGAPWRGGPGHDIRAVLATQAWECVGYRLHDVRLVRTTDEAELVGHLGPDVLGPDWDPDEALRRLRAHPAEQIGVALLDQRNLAGIGNLYKVESLFLTGVHPWTRVADVPDLPGLVQRARTLMRANLEHPEQSTTGSTRRGEDHWVFGRRGRPCRRCRSTILLGDQGPDLQERVTWWGPTCQAARSPIDPAARTGEPGRSPSPAGRS
jgi:endonuclease-8